jgi:hypothetical protein
MQRTAYSGGPLGARRTLHRQRPMLLPAGFLGGRDVPARAHRPACGKHDRKLPKRHRAHGGCEGPRPRVRAALGRRRAHVQGGAGDLADGSVALPLDPRRALATVRCREALARRECAVDCIPSSPMPASAADVPSNARGGPCHAAPVEGAAPSHESFPASPPAVALRTAERSPPSARGTRLSRG